MSERSDVFDEKRLVPEEALKKAYERVRRVRTIVVASTVSDASFLMWASYTLENKMGLKSPAEWHDIPDNWRWWLEMAHFVDVSDDKEIERQIQKFKNYERAALEFFYSMKGHGDTAETLFKELGVSSLDELPINSSDLAAFVEIAMPDILDWLQKRAPRDPSIWHEMPRLNWDYEELYKILRWIVEQPECDAATAIDILNLMEPDTTMDITSGGTRWVFNHKDSDPETRDEVQLLKTICLRSEDGSFKGPTLKQGFDPSENLDLLNMMRGELVKIEAAGRMFPFPLPVRLLSAPEPENLAARTRPIIANDDRIEVPISWGP